MISTRITTTTTTTTSKTMIPSSFLLLALLTTFPKVVEGSSQSTVFRKDTIKDPSNLIDLTFKSRIILPYGPDLYSNNPKQSNTDQPYKGYGYGMVSII